MQTIACASSMLTGEHLRSKLPAALLLCNLAQRAEYSGKVADLALLPLAAVLMESGPGWAQQLQLQVHVASAIKSLTENVLVSLLAPLMYCCCLCTSVEWCACGALKCHVYAICFGICCLSG